MVRAATCGNRLPCGNRPCPYPPPGDPPGTGRCPTNRFLHEPVLTPAGERERERERKRKRERERKRENERERKGEREKV